jgi:hypothetical protein
MGAHDGKEDLLDERKSYQTRVRAHPRVYHGSKYGETQKV